LFYETTCPENVLKREKCLVNKISFFYLKDTFLPNLAQCGGGVRNFTHKFLFYLIY
jgi:hypothetical protein